MSESSKPTRQPEQSYDLDQTDESLKAKDITRAVESGPHGSKQDKD